MPWHHFLGVLEKFGRDLIRIAIDFFHLLFQCIKKVILNIKSVPWHHFLGVLEKFERGLIRIAIVFFHQKIKLSFLGIELPLLIFYSYFCIFTILYNILLRFYPYKVASACNVSATSNISSFFSLKKHS